MRRLIGTARLSPSARRSSPDTLGFMTLKSKIKTAMFGPPGEQARHIPRGLLKGLQFHIDTAHKSMRLMGLDETEVAGWTRRMSIGAETAVDVGTNDGWYAAFFASRASIKRVFGFEPVSYTHLTLPTNREV